MLDTALWSAVRALEEKMVLANRIVERARKANQMRAASLFEKRAREAEEQSLFLRKLLLTEQKDDIGDEIMQTSGD